MSVLLLALGTHTALASDLTPAWLHPSAVPAAGGDGELTVEGTALIDSVAYAAVRGVVAPVRRLTLDGAVALGTCDQCTGPSQRWAVGTAYDLTPGDAFNVAPVLGLSGGTPASEADEDWFEHGVLGDGSPVVLHPPRQEILLLPGVALEGGSEHVRFDLVGTYATYLARNETYQAVTQNTLLVEWGFEGGLTARFNEHHALRVGTTGLLPAITYRLDVGPFGLETSTLLGQGGGERLQLGVHTDRDDG